MKLFLLTRLSAVWLLAGLAEAQSVEDMMRMQRGYFRGEMVRFEGTASSGDLIAKNSDGDLYACAYDSKTYVELFRAKVTVAKLEPGDPLEILADRHPGSRMCYVRIVHVVPPQRRDPRRETPRPALRSRNGLTRGDRTIAGFVVRVDGEWLTLRTREGDVSLRILRDTRFFSDGQSVRVDALAVNTRVSVRAGPAPDGGELEAYQVAWGEIVTVQ